MRVAPTISAFWNLLGFKLWRCDSKQDRRCSFPQGVSEMWRKHTDKDVTVNGAHRYKADRREEQRLQTEGRRLGGRLEGRTLDLKPEGHPEAHCGNTGGGAAGGDSGQWPAARGRTRRGRPGSRSGRRMVMSHGRTGQGPQTAGGLGRDLKQHPAIPPGLRAGAQE